ncbi:MAG TPA: TetR/AcrR family transcriptional regulator [Solirubrobacteraceae bacterium]|nr:TetR/AcrR family transcriptional regulator [Solirubrobacteraceae bacterium]
MPTRDAILERSADLASTEGLEGLTIGRLATALDMSKSGLFAHFGSKQELQLATVQAAAQRFVAGVIEPAQAAPEGLPRLRRYCELYVDHMERRAFPGGCFWAAAAAEFDDRPGPVRDAIRGGVEAWLGELARQAEAAGLADSRQVAFELWAIGLGANAYRRLLGDAAAFDRARTAIARRLDAA